MKKNLLSKAVVLGSLIIYSSAFASADGQIVTKCRLYNPPNNSLEIPSVGEQKFELNGISVEVKETNGCAMECFSIKKLSITKNGITFSTESESEKRTILYPSLSITENGTTNTVQCLLTRGQ